MNKPIFQSTYESFSEADALVLSFLINSLKGDYLRLCEVGSWLGTGSTTTAIHALSQKAGVLYCVDTWRGSSNVPNQRDILENYDVLGTFMHNITQAGGLEVVKPMVMSSLEAAQIVSDAALDLVFLDADHGYSSILKDIRAWYPKVKPGGILCGHDCELRPNQIDPELLRNNREGDAIAAPGHFAEIHPGPILAVHEMFRRTANLASEQPIELPDKTLIRSSIWWVLVN